MKVCMVVCDCKCKLRFVERKKKTTHKLFVFQGGPSGQRVGESSFPGLYHRLETRGKKEKCQS